VLNVIRNFEILKFCLCLPRIDIFVFAIEELHRIRQHTSAYVSIACLALIFSFSQSRSCTAYVSIRQHTSAYVSIACLALIFSFSQSRSCTNERKAPSVFRYSVYLLYWYKSTNTDTEGAAEVFPFSQSALPLFPQT
jgi:hypothetical protein